MEGSPRDTEPHARHQLSAAGRLAGVGYFSADPAADSFQIDERCREILGTQVMPGGFGELLSLLRARLHGEDIEGIRAAIASAAKGGGTFEVRGRLAAADGDIQSGERWLAASGTITFSTDGAGGATALSGALLDHTEERLREERWLRGQKREALGSLAAGIAHDLNNVMGAIIGNIALADRELNAGRSPAESIQEVQRASRRAGEMLRRLLNFGREDTPARTRFQVSEIVEEACRLMAPTIDPSIQLTTPDPHVDSWVIGDPAQIHQVVINLISNATFVLSGGGRIAITLQTDPPPANTMRLSVSDNGPGIPETIRPRIFDAFFTTKKPEEGTGLGLAAAATIIAMHNGTISVTSQEGTGTTFTVLLPRTEVELGAGEPGASDPEGRRGKVRVAVVAPDPEHRYQAIVSMPSFGCIPVVFPDARAALAALALDPTGFDALISDASPPADPHQLIRRARALRGDLPVIIHAGPDAALTPSEALALGADTWIPRPCPPSELCAAILQLVR